MHVHKHGRENWCENRCGNFVETSWNFCGYLYEQVVDFHRRVLLHICGVFWAMFFSQSFHKVFTKFSQSFHEVFTEVFTVVFTDRHLNESEGAVSACSIPAPSIHSVGNKRLGIS